MNKKLIILVSAIISIAIFKLLPADKEILKGLAILFFIGALWITESLPITATALLVPVIAVMTGRAVCSTSITSMHETAGAVVTGDAVLTWKVCVTWRGCRAPVACFGMAYFAQTVDFTYSISQ